MFSRLDLLRKEKNEGANHDIKALANGVLCMSSLLEGTPLSIEQAEIVYLLKKSAEQLGVIMANALDQSSADSSKYNNKMESFNLNEALDTVFNTFRITIRNKPISVRLIVEGKVPATVKGDKSAMNRILSNLLHNAGKFTERGKIELHVSAEQKEDNKAVVHFSVIDTGIGIAQEHLGSIFNHYTKFNSDGYGLGLANAKILVENNGGQISANSQLGYGTTFSFHLPYEISHQRATQKVVPLGVMGLKDARILIADDDDVYIKYLTTILKTTKANLTIVKSGREALLLAQKEVFDIIILDLRLPELDGYEVAYQIRNTLNFNTHTPVLGMSAGEPDREKMIIANIEEVLPKPLNTEGLVTRLQRVLVESQKNKSAIKVEDKSTFTFNKELDSVHLFNLYGDDYEHAAIMFETFLENSLIYWNEVLAANSLGDAQKVKDKAHRFKPATSMVGLTEIEFLIGDLERNVHQYSKEQIGEIIYRINQKLVYFKPILENELKRLKTVAASMAA